MVETKYRAVDYEGAKALSLVDFLERELGVNASKMSTGYRMSSCPACGESKKKNSLRLSITIDDKQWHCFACDDRGSIVDAGMRLWGVDSAEAVERLVGSKDFIRVAAPVASRQERDDKAVLKKAAFKDAFGKLQQACQQFADEEKPLRYLVDDRKIPIELVRKAQDRGMVAFLPADAGKASKVLIDAVGTDLLREVGLWKPDKKIPGVSFRPLVFFLPGLSSAEFRVIGEVKEDEAKSIRYGAFEFPYWWQGKDAQCMIVEGMIDMLSAVALGFTGHVMGLSGCTTWKPDWFPRAVAAHGIRRYVVMLDNDIDGDRNSGQIAAVKLKTVIESQGIPVCIKTPERGDINDILKKRHGS